MNIRKLLCLSGLLCAGSHLAAQQWQTVGNNTTLTNSNASYTNLVTDEAGNYYVSYYGGGVSRGSVQKFNGTSWNFLGGAGITPGFATYNALAVNSSQEVYYCYQDGSNSSRLSARKYSPVTGTWSDIGTAISGSVVNYQCMKTEPSTGLPVVSYMQGGSGIHVIRYDGTTWQQVGPNAVVTGGTGAVHALAVKTDTAFIAVQTGTSYSVYKAPLRNGTAWMPVGLPGFVTGGSSNQFTVSLALDASQSLYMAFRGLSANGGKIAVYKYDHNSWQPVGQPYFSTGNVEHISLAVSASGMPCVAYRDNTLGRTDVQQFNGTGWESLGLPSDNIGNWNALAIDPAGNTIVAFADGTGVNGGLVTVKKLSSADGVPLPVSLLYFTAVRQGNANKLFWKTAMEDGDEVFRVERSTDSRQFNTIFTIPARQPAAGLYTTTDAGLTEPVYYYRLCITHRDGTKKYSAIVKTSTAATTAPVQLTAYPNPVTDQLLLNCPPQHNGLTAILMDVQGRMYQRIDIRTGTQLVNLPVSMLAKGSYLLHVTAGAASYTIPIVKN